MAPPQGRRRLPRNVKSMSKEVLQATLKKKKECEARALEVVERLLEEDVTQDTFLGSLPLIQECHFQDVVEERAISRLCGYPLCSSRLDRPQLQQRYRICTKANKVYDLTERKNFCSNLCYKSARFVKDQLLTSPLWLRDGDNPHAFTLLDAFASGVPAGDEVDIGTVPSLKEELEKLTVEDCSRGEDVKKQVTVEDCSRGEDVKEKVTVEDDGGGEDVKKKVTVEDCSRGEDVKEQVTVEDCSRGEDVKEKVTVEDDGRGEDVKKKLTVEDDGGGRRVTQLTRDRRTAGPDLTAAADVTAPAGDCEAVAREAATRRVEARSPVARVESSLREWVTQESLTLLKDPATASASLLVDSSRTTHDDQRGAVVQMDTLKVRAFLEGRTCYEAEVGCGRQTNYLPLVDGHAKRALRRRIVLDRLRNVIPGLAHLLQLSSQDVAADLRELVSTFSLEAHNITFRPPEWSLMALLLLKMISMKNAKVRSALDCEAAKDHAAKVLALFGLAGEDYLDRLSGDVLAQHTTRNDIL